jgi:GntR family transcriptional regulator / MocR family aminotransferase
MGPHVRIDSGVPLAPQIYRQLRAAILDGRLRAGVRLPSTRTLAQQLRVARNTVAVAYELLVADGLLEGRVGAGSFVRATGPRTGGSRRAPVGVVRPRTDWRARVRDTASVGARYDFRVGVPDASLFPAVTWSRLLARAARTLTTRANTYGDPRGLEALRAAIARHIGVSRAVRADPSDVLITQGAQQAFDLVARVLISPGSCVAMEEPGYPVIRALFESYGARVVGVPVDAEGLDVAALPRAATLVYVTPSHQFPLGLPMSLARRTALLDWATRRGAVILEDDYDSEFRFGGQPLDPLQHLDRNGRVVYVGSFSKVLLPGLRLGFLVAPASLHAALCAARQLSDWHGVTMMQAALATFIDDGHLAAHLRKVGREYAERHARLTDALVTRCASWLRLIPSAAGLHLAAAIDPGIAVATLLERGRRRGVLVQPLSAFSHAPAQAPAGLVLGFGAIPATAIDHGIRELGSSAGRLTRPSASPVLS